MSVSPTVCQFIDVAVNMVFRTFVCYQAHFPKSPQKREGAISLMEQSAHSIPGPLSPCSSSVYHTRCRNVVLGGMCSNWRRKWQPTPVSLPRKFHQQRILVGYSPQDHKESDTTERLTQHITHAAVCLTFFFCS